MAEHHPELDLPYGHFGRGEYDIEAQRWRFTRAAPVRSGLILIITYDVDSPSKAGDEDGEQNTDTHARHTAKSIAALTQIAPELRIVEDLLPPLLQTSLAVQNAVRHADPMRGDLLSIARMSSPSERTMVPVAATVSATDRSQVQFVVMGARQVGWGDARQAWIEAPSLQGGEVHWDGNGAPIDQVLLSVSDQRGIRLAVRQQRRITLLKPSIPMNARVALVPVASLQLSSTEQASFAHVAFNPWSYRQVAIIDQHGHWRIVDDRRGRTVENCNGFVRDAVGEDGDTLDDGWARIEWVANVSTVIACTRRNMCLFGVDAAEARLIEHVDARTSASSTWILGLRVISKQPEFFLVLTTVHMLVYRVAQKGFADVVVELQGAVRHFKSPDDLTLRMTVCDEHDDILVLVTSTTTDLAMTYRVILEDGSRARIEEPQRALLSKNSSADSKRSSETIGVYVLPANLKFGSSSRRGGEGSNLPESLYGHSAKVYSVAILHSDLSISETLSIVSARQRPSPETTVEPPTWTKIVSKAPKPRYIFDAEDSSESEEVRQEPRPRYHRRFDEGPRKANRKPKNFEPLVRMLQTESQASIETTLSEIMERLGSEGATENPTLRTLDGFLQHEVTTGDIDDAAAALERFSSSLANLPLSQDDIVEPPRLSLVLETTPQPRIDDDDNDLPPPHDLRATYDDLVATYITSLPPSVPARARVARDRLARIVAAQLALSSLVIRPSEAPSEPAPKTESPMNDNTWSLPVRSVNIPSSPPNPLSLPTPSPTTTPSVTTASSYRSLNSASAYSRLSAYTTFSKPAPPPLPRALRNVLSHWTDATDVTSYDWVATSRALAQADEDDEMTPAERARLARKAERHLRRQRREAAASEKLRLASSQVPELSITKARHDAGQRGVMRIKSGRDHGRSDPAAPSSSQTQSQSQSQNQIPASQPLPGRFGGRPPVKKKRKQGF